MSGSQREVGRAEVAQQLRLPGPTKDSRFGDLTSCIGPQALEELAKFWENEAGRAKRRNLPARLQTFDNFMNGLEPGENDELAADPERDPDADIPFAESGCDEVCVNAVGRERDYPWAVEEPTFIVGFEAVGMLVRNPHLFDPSQLTIRPGWSEESRRFTALRGCLTILMTGTSISPPTG
jgi:hypothetical protein